MNRSLNLSGVFLALTTPFDTNGEVSIGHLRANIHAYDKVGLSGYLVIGSTGESVFLEAAEIEATLAAVRESAAPGRILIAGTGAESTAQTIAQTNAAANLGYDCALVQMPNYFKTALKTREHAEHYRRVADASRIPILLYSVPQYTGVAVEPELVAQVADHPNIIGMKDSSGNVVRMGEIMAAAPERFQMLTGAAGAVYPSMLLGSKGAILALGDFLPELCLELYNAAARKDATAARELQLGILGASKRVVGGMGIPGVKYAMDCRGYYGGPPRPPLLPLGDAQKREVDSILASLAPAAAPTLTSSAD